MLSLHILLLVSAARGLQPKRTGNQLDDTQGNRLKFVKNSDREIHVELHGLGFRGKFGAGQHDGESRLYAVGTNENILSLTSTEFGHTWHFREHNPISINGSASPSSIAPHLSRFLAHGHELMTKIEEFKLVTTMSRMLGEAGMDGRSKPVTLWLHLLSLRFREIEAELAKNAISEDKTTFLHKVEERMQFATKLEPSDNFGKTLQRKATPQPPPYSITPVAACGNKCFGLCGLNCNCLSWVCGDCQTHRGCWEHDCYCSCRGTFNSRCLSFKAHPSTCNSWFCAASYCEQENVQPTC